MTMPEAKCSWDDWEKEEEDSSRDNITSDQQ